MSLNMNLWIFKYFYSTIKRAHQYRFANKTLLFAVRKKKIPEKPMQ